MPADGRPCTANCCTDREQALGLPPPGHHGTPRRKSPAGRSKRGKTWLECEGSLYSHHANAAAAILLREAGLAVIASGGGRQPIVVGSARSTVAERASSGSARRCRGVGSRGTPARSRPGVIKNGPPHGRRVRERLARGEQSMTLVCSRRQVFVARSTRSRRPGPVATDRPVPWLSAGAGTAGRRPSDGRR